MNKDELRTIIEKHEKWLKDHKDGERADFSGTDLSGVDLVQTNLSGANLCGANLYGANLYGAELRGADLRDADLSCVDLYTANLCGADLRGADLHHADLRHADLRYTDLRRIDLYDADLLYTDLCGADLREAKNVPFIPMVCPDSGSFTAWKKARGYIIKLLIPEDARRSSATGRKCRCDKAIVLAIETLDGMPSELTEIASIHDSAFIYRVGETVAEPNFCEDRFNECSEGIHFFINRQEAVDY